MWYTLVIVVASASVGALASWRVARGWPARGRNDDASRTTVSRIEAHLSSSATSEYSPATSEALRRDIQEVFEITEANQDLEVLDRLLRDIRDLLMADEAILWRWVESRQALVPSAWSTEDQPRPAFFNVIEWGPLVRASAEQRAVQFAGDVGGASEVSAAPVIVSSTVYGVLTVSAAAGLHADRDAAGEWMERFSAQVAGLIRLFNLRRDYGRHMRHSEALLDAVQRLQGHRSTDALANALCDTAREVTSAPVAGLVRWNAAEFHGVVQAVSAGADIETGFHVTADTLVGRVCTTGLPTVLEDARAATAERCPFGGLPRMIGSLAIVPVVSGDEVIGALIVEAPELGAIGRHEARNIGLVAAIARGPLEIVWEIEEVSRRARTDSLTGLANRRHLDDQLRRMIAETDRFGGTCSLIMADLDLFKEINDTYGHDAGDAVLRHVAQVLSEGVRTVDTCARYGGEEIAVLLPQTSEQGAAELAERLRVMLETRPAMRDDKPLRVTASFGVATYPAPVPYGDWLLPAADKAMYEAKAAGRNCVRVIQPSHVTPALYKSH